jgi:hypothetical protein
MHWGLSASGISLKVSSKFLKKAVGIIKQQQWRTQGVLGGGGDSTTLPEIPKF